jgi:hypothetical protein
MAERLPIGAARNVRSPSNSISNDLSIASIDRLNIQATSPESDVTGSYNQLFSNGSSTVTDRSVGHCKHSLSEAASRNGSKTKDNESRNETEWVEQDEPGVYITLTSLSGGAIDLKRVRFRYGMLYCLDIVFFLSTCITHL